VLIFGLGHFYRRAENWLGVATETYLVIFDLAIFIVGLKIGLVSPLRPTS
jgi:hypothetical protein